MIDVAKLTNIAMRAGLTSPCGAALDAISKLPRPGADVSFAPPPPRHVDDRHLELVAASLAGGMIVAGGKAVTAEEAVGVWREVREAMRAAE